MSLKTLSVADLEMARRHLRELPQLEPKDRKDLSPMEVLKALRPELKELEQKGYTQAQIHQEVKAAGVEVGLNTVKRLLHGNRRKTRAQSEAATTATEGAEHPPSAAAEKTAQESVIPAPPFVAENALISPSAAVPRPGAKVSTRGLFNRGK